MPSTPGDIFFTLQMNDGRGWVNVGTRSIGMHGNHHSSTSLLVHQAPARYRWIIQKNGISFFFSNITLTFR